MVWAVNAAAGAGGLEARGRKSPVGFRGEFSRLDLVTPSEAEVLL